MDTCWDATGTKIVEPASYDAANRCNALYPVHSEPRLVAGAPLAGVCDFSKPGVGQVPIEGTYQRY